MTRIGTRTNLLESWVGVPAAAAPTAETSLGGGTHSPLRRWIRQAGAWFRRLSDDPDYMPEDERRAVLLLVSGMIRGGHYDDAEVLLRLTLRRCPCDARCLNLLGIVYEARKDWPQARRYYSRAMAANSGLADPRQNMRRVFELSTVGIAREPIALGDEAKDGEVPVLHAFPPPSNAAEGVAS